MSEDADLDNYPAIVDEDNTMQPRPCSKFKKIKQHTIYWRLLTLIKNQHPWQFVHTALRTCRQIHDEVIPFLYEGICLSYSPWGCLSASEQHGRRLIFSVRHLNLIKHLRLTFNRKAKYLDPYTIIEAIHHFSASNSSPKRLDLRFNTIQNETTPFRNRV